MDFIESRKRTTEFLSRVALLRRGAFAGVFNTNRGASRALVTSKARRITSSSLHVWTLRPAASEFSLLSPFGADGRVYASNQISVSVSILVIVRPLIRCGTPKFPKAQKPQQRFVKKGCSACHYSQLKCHYRLVFTFYKG